MNKFIFAFVAFLAVVNAKPSNSYSAPSVAYEAIPVHSNYAAPSLAYQNAPLISSYGEHAYGGYGEHAYAAPSLLLQPLAVPYLSSHHGKASPLVAAPSNPSASAAAAAAAGQLNAGKYAQYAIPSYEIISGIPAEKAVHGGYGPSY